MIVLGIESSCDDTAAAVLVDREVRSSVVASQDAVHQKYGGIVPELASRSHLRAIVPVIEQALSQAHVTLADVNGIAVTAGPGLVGSLLVGLSTAKAIAFARRLPLVGVNHLEGHLLSPQLEGEVAFPYLVLLVSGGHTSVYWAEGYGRYRCLGLTRDDAAGEAFDKVAKILGLGFPGGRAIDELARTGDREAIRFPRARIKPGRSGRLFDFSFSGLKTAVWQYVRDQALVGDAIAAVAASFQEAVVDQLLDTTLAAANDVGAHRLVIAGGVAANSRLRERALAAGAKFGLAVSMPSFRYCTDNAAMIAYAGGWRLARGDCDPFTLNAAADLEL
ncbi:MAG: tRNA (adenosine(37)-N6)-threonylcarbamoyltransferase complex transferase subunit TsaD [Deltaproteobacteria bacterium]|nr:tRNA (adenosine(37)-N6)-threonylcarbamoyltransferase complex transferase subunit TsaD [Deltaproteobacteria bacterium]MBI3389673.1 tRNA (adenosine(37)-N6)-threonylcarbamoyltransferase complex transferase subunit TsaD [Deltaproteobacteria bacterium]